MTAPFVGKRFEFQQPDGSVLSVIGWGNQYSARFETLDGYTVVKNLATGFYEYARLSDDDEKSLVPSGCVPGLLVDPQALRLEKGLKQSKIVSQEEARINRAQHKQDWKSRIKEKKVATSLHEKALAHNVSFAAGFAPPAHTTVEPRVGLTLLIEFPDVLHTIPMAEVQRYCNDTGYKGFGNNGSVKDYYLDNSGGLFTFTNIVTPWYKAKHPRSYYTDPKVPQGKRAQELIKEALTFFKKTPGVVAFSDLSHDMNGHIYALSTFYAGVCVNRWAEGLWPHSSSLVTPFSVGTGIFVKDYQITDMTNELSLGTFCHENGHMVCDFPDLYDYGYESNGVGIFCLMCAGGSYATKNPAQISAYLKYKAGWGRVTFIAQSPEPVAYTAKNNEFFVFEKSKTEYFIIEGRFKAGRDSDALKKTGLAIWHVDELGDQNYQQMTSTRHYECSLEQADGRFDLEHGHNNGDDGDLFVGTKEFSSTTTPNSKWWNGHPSGLRIFDIVCGSDSISFKVQV